MRQFSLNSRQVQILLRRQYGSSFELLLSFLGRFGDLVLAVVGESGRTWHSLVLPAGLTKLILGSGLNRGLGAKTKPHTHVRVAAYIIGLDFPYAAQ